MTEAEIREEQKLGTTSTRNTAFDYSGLENRSVWERWRNDVAFNQEDFDYFTRDEVTVGDLSSDEQGSGARKSEGKIALDLIPVRYWLQMWSRQLSVKEMGLVHAFAEWQERVGTAYEMMNCFKAEDLIGASKVLTYGADKYRAWNWAKGMPYSVPTGCILRHLEAIARGDLIDDESGESHWSHVVCNVMMLAWYEIHYTEGDDRPPVYRS